MLVVISPAKKLNMDGPAPEHETTPMFPGDTGALVEMARELSQDDLRKLMGISADLAKLNQNRFVHFGSQETKAALYLFAGDTYQGLDAKSLGEDALRWAQDHLRILSGLYGLLRPLDAMEPYRLEMGSRLRTARGKNLYEFWGDKLSSALNVLAKETNARYLVNCASQEYFGAVDRGVLSFPVLTPVFLERRDGSEKVISFYAKKARGAMARYIVENRITEPDGLKEFDLAGYNYDAARSDAASMVFVREATS